MTRCLLRFLASAALPVALLVACADPPSLPPAAGSARDCKCECQPAAGRRLSAELLARLASARAYHHQADLLLSRNEIDKAIEKVRAILALDLSSRWPEAEEVRLDATARLARLLAKNKHVAKALVLVQAELARKPRPSFYAANLHSVRGELLEEQVKALDAAGKKVEAKALARRALAAFEQSIQLNKALQAQLRQQKKPAVPSGSEASEPQKTSEPQKKEPGSPRAPGSGGAR